MKHGPVRRGTIRLQRFETNYTPPQASTPKKFHLFFTCFFTVDTYGGSSASPHRAAMWKHPYYRFSTIPRDAAVPVARPARVYVRVRIFVCVRPLLRHSRLFLCSIPEQVRIHGPNMHHVGPANQHPCSSLSRSLLVRRCLSARALMCLSLWS